MDKSNPSIQNLKALEQFFADSQMDLQQFCNLYPDISREQLAKIADCSISTVNHWFCGAQKPTKAHKLRMAIAHWFWVQSANEPELFKQLREMQSEFLQ
jgi:transcriptional regulator with XRE-family HTH domain